MSGPLNLALNSLELIFTSPPLSIAKKAMSRLLLDGLARLQNKSRIPASKWREWCDVLGLDPVDAGETWEEVCYPLMIATRLSLIHI